MQTFHNYIIYSFRKIKQHKEQQQQQQKKKKKEKKKKEQQQQQQKKKKKKNKKKKKKKKQAWTKQTYCMLLYISSSTAITITILTNIYPKYSYNHISSCGHGTKAVIQTHKSINQWRIRMFRPTDMDPRTKGVIRRPRIVSINW